jgi:uncharacterized protein YgbK (DUF1537 family)
MKVAVFADDLTGANATGVRLSKQGFTSATIVRGSPLPEASFDAVCFDTDSRQVSAAEARERVTAALRQARRRRPRLVCKRIDSTLRGNVGAELDAVLEELGSDYTAIVVPAFPDSGRITFGGTMLVNGVPLIMTDAARDPVSPIQSSRVADVLSRQSKFKPASVHIDIVAAEGDSLGSHIEELIEQGSRVIVTDAVSERQIDQIAASVATLGRKIVAVDPGPFTAALSRHTYNDDDGDNTEQKIFLAVGSATSLTKQQLTYFIEENDPALVHVKPEELIRTADEKTFLASIVDEFGPETGKKPYTVITTCHLESETLNLAEIAKEMGMNKEAAANRLTRRLAMITRELMIENRDSVGGCVLSGGEVTASFCKETSSEGIELLDEVFPLAAYGRILGGSFAGTPVVTKGGMVGGEDAFVRCARYLSQKNSY